MPWYVREFITHLPIGQLEEVWEWADTADVSEQIMEVVAPIVGDYGDDLEVVD